tara:strand:+ start:564 stop:887 length:324 start_codon:yes stop_codon:yes gene_type:complete
MLNQHFTGKGNNYSIFIDSENPFGNTPVNATNGEAEIQSEPINQNSTTYEADHSNKGFLCKDIKCNHLNDVLCVVCIVIGGFLSWAFTVTFVSPRHINDFNSTNFTG